MRRDERRHVIEVAVVLVVAEDENRLPPHVGILRENVERFGDVPRAIPRRARVVGEILRRDDPRNRRQFARAHILAELVEHIALRDPHPPLHATVVIGDLRPSRGNPDPPRWSRTPCGGGLLRAAAAWKNSPPSIARARAGRLPVADALGAHLFGDRCGPRLRCRLQLRERVRKRLHQLLEVLPMPRAKPHAVLGEVFERIVAEVRQPRVLSAPARSRRSVRSDRRTTRRPPLRAARETSSSSTVVSKSASSFRTHALACGVGLVANRPRPEVQPVRRRAGERRAEVLVADRERVGERVIERNVLAGVIAERERLARVIVVSARLSSRASGRAVRRCARAIGRPSRAAGSPSTSPLCPGCSGGTARRFHPRDSSGARPGCRPAA